MTTRDQIHALRWRAAADALALDPSRDPDIASLAVLRTQAAAGRDVLKYGPIEGIVAAKNRDRCAELFGEISDLLAERMALLDAERPGVTLIECVQGMLEATAQKPASSEADKDLVELTRPIWVLLPRGAPRDMSPRGVVQQMAEILAAVACAGV